MHEEIVEIILDSSFNLSALSSTGITTKRIAILTPVTHPSLMKIEEGFVQTLKQQDGFNYEFSVFNANGNEILLRSQVEEAASQNYDLIFCIGTHTTCVTKEVLTKKQKEIPVIFGAIEKPVEL